VAGLPDWKRKLVLAKLKAKLDAEVAANPMPPPSFETQKSEEAISSPEVSKKLKTKAPNY